MSNIEPGIYKHYKGTVVEAIGVANHSETLEPLVVYKKLESHKNFPAGSLWVRPQKMFLETVQINGKQTPRFSKVASPIIRFRDIFWIGIFPFIIFMINYTLYTTVREWGNKVYIDDYLHFLGGAAIAFSTSHILSILESQVLIHIKNALLKLLIILASVALAAVVWECYEFILDILYTPINQPSVPDTIKDMVMGLLGGTVTGSILIHFFNKSKKPTV